MLIYKIGNARLTLSWCAKKKETQIVVPAGTNLPLEKVKFFITLRAIMTEPDRATYARGGETYYLQHHTTTKA
jgi:hypothetical protein